MVVTGDRGSELNSGESAWSSNLSYYSVPDVLQNKPLISEVIVVAVPGLSSGLFQAKLEILSSFTALPAPVKLLAKSAMVRPGETIPQLFKFCCSCGCSPTLMCKILHAHKDLAPPACQSSRTAYMSAWEVYAPVGHYKGGSIHKCLLLLQCRL